ncbi:MAG: hypothetical protein A2049_10855 [Elusimicrobia bacterium GWA2_62_23]|nr:MAG: hypothetical protein A2049_10855 [Elusimicrobia bacterium GWA2_62_23]OGR73821.1 MAG: hypothetical protein A2179_01450 [Elusimicrobia bacterium GWC2_63_65]
MNNKLTEKLLPLTLCLAAALAGCLNPMMFKKGAYAIDDWETWTGWNDAYGSHEATPDGVYYRLTERQDDTRDMSSDGYSPGLILSRELMGQNWILDLEADFKIPPGQVKRFSYGVWVGGDSVRPSIANPSATIKIVAQRQNGPKPGDDALLVFYLPGGKPFAVPRDAKVLRFARSGNVFSAAYAMNRKKFTPLFSVEAPAAADAPSQKFFIGGFAGGDPAGAYARLTSLRINGRETLR